MSSVRAGRFTSHAPRSKRGQACRSQPQAGHLKTYRWFTTVRSLGRRALSITLRRPVRERLLVAGHHLEAGRRSTVSSEVPVARFCLCNRGRLAYSYERLSPITARRTLHKRRSTPRFRLVTPLLRRGARPKDLDWPGPAYGPLRLRWRLPPGSTTFGSVTPTEPSRFGGHITPR